MISEAQVDQLNKALKRLFALPLSRMTLRELQNIISQTIPGNQEAARVLMDAFITGKVPENLKNGSGQGLTALIDSYSSHVRMAREISEMGEFINSFSCDIMQQGNQVFFMNRMRRIDGEEIHFIAAPDMNVRLAHLLIRNLKELKRNAGQNFKIDEGLKEELQSLQEDVQYLLSQ